MTVLIELFDSRVPFNNFLLCRLLRPGELVLFAPEDGPDLSAEKERFYNFIRYFRLDTNISFVRADTGDIGGTKERLKETVDRYGEDSCVVDIVGGGEALLVAAGMCMAEYPGLRVVSLRNERPALIGGKDRQDALFGALNTDLTVREVISLAAGELIRCGHADWRAMDEYVFSSIPVMFGIYMKNRDSWPAFTAYLQRLNSPGYRLKEGVFSGPTEFTVNPVTGKKTKVNLNIIRDLMGAGFVTDFRMTAANCRLAFSHPHIVKYLCDTGSWLELYVFSALKGSGAFNDIEIDPVVSWDNDDDNDDTVNEVDLIAMKGTTPIFISCKSGIPGNEAVYEIGEITRRFGNYHARAVLVTACDMARDAESVRKRAEDSGVEVIDAGMLNAETLPRLILEGGRVPEAESPADGT